MIRAFGPLKALKGVLDSCISVFLLSVFKGIDYNELQ
jgi:hypothetical protein